MNSYKELCEFMLENFAASIEPMLKAHEAYKRLSVEEEKVNLGKASPEPSNEFNETNPQEQPAMVKEQPNIIKVTEQPKPNNEEEELF